MKYRVLQGFVLGPGRIARPGDVIEIEEKTVKFAGITLRLGHVIHPSCIEPYVEAPEPSASSAARDIEPQHRDPEVSDRDPRPRRRRGSR